MLPKSHRYSLVLAVAAAMAAPAVALAQASGDTARVLPQGLFKADIHYVYTTTGRLQQKGALPEEAASQEVELLTELIGANSDFGNANIAYQGSAQVLAPALFYGLHDRVSVGFVVPVFLNARVDIHELDVGTGEIGYNPDFSRDPTRQSPVLSARDPRAVRGAEGIQRMLTDVFQYEPLESWSNSGLGDLQAYARTSLLAHRNARAAIQTGVTVPTGETDNIDNLVDFGLGSGQVDLGVLGLMDLSPASWLTLNVRGGYTFQLPNKQDARVYNDASIPLAPIDALPEQFEELGQRRSVVRDLGDMWQAGGTLHLASGVLIANASFDYYKKGLDTYRSDEGPHAALGVGTNYSVQTIGGMFGVDFVQAYLDGSAPLPVTFDVTVSQAISDDDTSNMTTAMTRFTLYFGSADSAKKASNQ